MTSYGGAGQVYHGVWGSVDVALKESYRYECECECESDSGEESVHVFAKYAAVRVLFAVEFTLNESGSSMLPTGGDCVTIRECVCTSIVCINLSDLLYLSERYR